jgi:hypothetical protein
LTVRVSASTWDWSALICASVAAWALAELFAPTIRIRAETETPADSRKRRVKPLSVITPYRLPFWQLKIVDELSII